jgi:phospholipase C
MRHGVLRLRAVSWIDPSFTNFNPLGFPVNDDHPRADIKDGQELVLAVYDALAASPNWSTSLLVVTYDEHGGFHDHVPPPTADDDEPEMFGRYGVRVPAFVVSPWVDRRMVTHTLLDHTAIIKTILTRFCPQAMETANHLKTKRARLDGKPHGTGVRTATANHLGELLTRTSPRSAPSRDELVRAAATRADRASRRLGSEPTSPRTAQLNDLQIRIRRATRELRKQGHPLDQP